MEIKTQLSRILPLHLLELLSETETFTEGIQQCGRMWNRGNKTFFFQILYWFCISIWPLFKVVRQT